MFLSIPFFCGVVVEDDIFNPPEKQKCTSTVARNVYYHYYSQKFESH